MEKSEEEIEKEFENEIESIINRKPKKITEEDIKKGFELSLKRDFNITDESIKLIYVMADGKLDETTEYKLINEGRNTPINKQISISNLQRFLRLGYRNAVAIFDKVIYLYAPQLIKNIENAIDNKRFNIKEIVFIDKGEFRQLQKIGNLFEICKNTENEYEFEIIDTEKFRELCKIILCLDYKLDYRKKFARII
ncbi:MAG: hypothetical protein IKB06_03015 [Clostridia bacterium]|nr:hypothetical protein [Clostridia bacterium]